MNVNQCKNCQKYFNADKYSVCPHCNGSLISQNTSDSDSKTEKTSKRGLFGKKEHYNTENIHTVPDNTVAKTFSAFGDSNKEDVNDIINNDISCEKDNVINKDVFEISNPDNIENNDVVEIDSLGKKTNTDNYRVDEPSGNGSISQTSLIDEVAKATKNDDGRTFGYFSFGDSNEDNSAGKVVQSNPVVGWLVCIQGAYLGQSFSLFDGNNSIGRNESNDIVLSREKSVSSNKHAIITYEPRKKVFYVQAGDGHALTYLNEDVVMGSKEICIYDLLELGESAFIFIPLCGEDFTWEKYLGR